MYVVPEERIDPSQFQLSMAALVPRKWGGRIWKKGYGGNNNVGVEPGSDPSKNSTNLSFGGSFSLHQASTQRDELQQFYIPS